MNRLRTAFGLGVLALLASSGVAGAADSCVDCHSKISPGQVQDWKSSRHAENDISCASCHGEAHTTAQDSSKAVMPSEKVCAECHEEQFTSFSHGKHNFGWSSLNAIPATHWPLMS